MDVIINRKPPQSNGIFGTLTDMDGSVIAATLEHAYGVAGSMPAAWAAKIPAGFYKCRRHWGPKFGWTWEVMNVPGHTDILFHAGNYHKDSDGCILLGTKDIEEELYPHDTMIEHSRAAVAAFDKMQGPTDSFQLTIHDAPEAVKGQT